MKMNNVNLIFIKDSILSGKTQNDTVVFLNTEIDLFYLDWIEVI